MVEVVSNSTSGLDEPQLKNMIENLVRYQGSLDKCNSVIQNYNLTIK